jgi:hypothetical protein
MKPQIRFLFIYFSLFILLIFFISFSFRLYNPFGNKCVQGDCKNGYGIYHYGSGKIYKGEWKNKKRHGQGTLNYPDGTRYEGRWKNNRSHGLGIKTSPLRGVYKYIGEWVNGKKYGKGTQYFSPEAWYEGEWKDGKMNGHGTYTHIRGSRTVGE